MNHYSNILVASTSIMIKESKNTAGPAWNFPSGRIEPGEDIITAARRESREETGLNIEILESAGFFQFTSRTGHPVFMFHFIAEIAGGSIELEEGMTEYSWFTVREILDMDESMLREPGVIRQIANSILQHKSFPLSFFQNIS
ncbi:NUDIX domain-containing protein [Bacillus infantis]|uniref:NUDIX hydrolase n=1 Tax=Bacillus infantis TaxID=324767 RepID=UPI003450D685